MDRVMHFFGVVMLGIVMVGVVALAAATSFQWHSVKVDAQTPVAMPGNPIPGPIACPRGCRVPIGAVEPPSALLSPGETVSFTNFPHGFVYSPPIGLTPALPPGVPVPTPIVFLALTNVSEHPATVTFTTDRTLTIEAPAGLVIRLSGSPPIDCSAVEGQAHVLRCVDVPMMPARLAFITESAREPDPDVVPGWPPASSPAMVAPGATVQFIDLIPEAPPGSHPPSTGNRRAVQVTNRSNVTIEVTFPCGRLVNECRTVTITGPDGSALEVGDDPVAVPVPTICAAATGRPNVVVCTVIVMARLAVTASAAPLPALSGSDQNPVLVAQINLTQIRPCIPAPGTTACDDERAALWGGDPEAWAARGVTDASTRFVETVLMRASAGDPRTIAEIAHVLGTPYLKVMRIEFRGAESVEIRNLGGGVQDLTGWTVRSPRGAVIPLPSGVVLQPGAHCTVITNAGPPLLNPMRECRAYTNSFAVSGSGLAASNGADVWPDEGGYVELTYDLLGLPGDFARYSADPLHQPPPPHLQLVNP